MANWTGHEPSDDLYEAVLTVAALHADACLDLTGADIAYHETAFQKAYAWLASHRR